MTTQKRTVPQVVASALVGAAVVAVLALGLQVAQGGLSQLQEWGLFGGGEASSEPVATREVVDCVGRTVAIPEEPCKIAASDSFSGNVCVLIGAGELLMGAPGGVLSDEMLQMLYPDLESLQRLSGDSLNVENLLEEGVDLVIVRSSMYESGQTDKLDTLGIPYVVVDYDTMEQQQEAILLLGEVCGGQYLETAQELVAFYKDTVSLVEERTVQIPEEERIAVFHSINDPLLTDGADSIGADWIARSGGVCVSAEEASTGAQGDYTATLEQVYVWNPDVVICSTVDAKQSILTDEQWQGLACVSDGQVYNLPVSTSRWGQRGDPETFLAMLWFGCTFYPDLYADVDLQETVCSYYRDIIGLDVDQELWDAILSGEGLRTQGNGSQGEK